MIQSLIEINSVSYIRPSTNEIILEGGVRRFVLEAAVLQCTTAGKGEIDGELHPFPWERSFSLSRKRHSLEATPEFIGTFVRPETILPLIFPTYFVRHISDFKKSCPAYIPAYGC